MTDDQHRIGQLTQARLAIAGALERFAAQPVDPFTVADWLLDQLRNLGWRPPLDLTDKPPLRPTDATTDGPGYAEWQQARAALAARRTNPRP